MNLKKYNKEFGIYYITPKNDNFSDIYIKVRQKEKRILSDNEVALLPITTNENPYKKEWKLRQKTTNNFIKYLNDKQQNLRILDIGCGNGWFANKMAQKDKHTVFGIDINETELKQAARIFKKNNLFFCYADIFDKNIPFKNTFDIITLNASIQYFEDLDKLLPKLKSFLKVNGKIHILDSPFYTQNEIIQAKERTINYFSTLGFPQMANNYYHHNINKMNDFDILYQPKKVFLKRIFNRKQSPFMWLRFIKEKM